MTTGAKINVSDIHWTKQVRMPTFMEKALKKRLIDQDSLETWR